MSTTTEVENGSYVKDGVRVTVDQGYVYMVGLGEAPSWKIDIAERRDYGYWVGGLRLDENQGERKTFKLYFPQIQI